MSFNMVENQQRIGHTEQTTPAVVRRYRRAARGTGVRIKVIAHENEQYTQVAHGIPQDKKITVKEGNVGILMKGKTGQDMEAFWKNYKMLIARDAQRAGSRRI